MTEYVIDFVARHIELFEPMYLYIVFVLCDVQSLKLCDIAEDSSAAVFFVAVRYDRSCCLRSL